MAITPATALGSAIPVPLDSTVVARMGISLLNSDQLASCGMYPPVASVIPDLMLPGATPNRETVLEHGDLIEAIELPASALARNSVYVKVRDRASYEEVHDGAALIRQ